MLETALAGPDARDVWRRVRYVVDQARAWTDAGGRGVRRYLRWAALPGGRGSGQRHDPARAGPRRRPRDDGARGQGPGVPDHGRQRADDRGPGQPRRCRSCGPATTWGLAEKDSDAVRGVQAARRADGRRRAPPAPVRRLHPGRRPPRRLAAPQAGERRRRHRQGHRAPPCWPRRGALGHGADRARRRRRAARRRSSADALELPWADAVAWDAERARAVAAGLGAIGHQRHRPRRSPSTDADRRRRRRRHRTAADAGPGQGRRRPRPAAVAARALRHVDRAGRPRRAAGRRPADRRRHRPPGRRPVRRRGHLRPRAARRRPVPVGARRADRRRRGGRCRALAGAVRRRRARRAPSSRGTSTCSCGPRPGWSSSTTRPTSGRPGADQAGRVARYRHQLAAYGLALGRLLDEPVAGGMLVRCRPDGPAEEIVIERWDEALAEVAASPALLAQS